MATISLTDVIFATIHLHGRKAAALRLEGVKSFADILSHLIKSAPALGGMATIEIRNGSQGWSTRRNVLLAGA